MRSTDPALLAPNRGMESVAFFVTHTDKSRRSRQLKLHHSACLPLNRSGDKSV
jgi:hypothetical protein